MIVSLRPLGLRPSGCNLCLNKGKERSGSMKNVIELWFVKNVPAGLPSVHKERPKRGLPKRRKKIPKKIKNNISYFL